jgi:hypothetical protein
LWALAFSRADGFPFLPAGDDYLEKIRAKLPSPEAKLRGFKMYPIDFEKVRGRDSEMARGMG